MIDSLAILVRNEAVGRFLKLQQEDHMRLVGMGNEGIENEIDVVSLLPVNARVPQLFCDTSAKMAFARCVSLRCQRLGCYNMKRARSFGPSSCARSH